MKGGDRERGKKGEKLGLRKKFVPRGVVILGVAKKGIRFRNRKKQTTRAHRGERGGGRTLSGKIGALLPKINSLPALGRGGEWVIRSENQRFWGGGREERLGGQLVERLTPSPRRAN